MLGRIDTEHVHRLTLTNHNWLKIRVFTFDRPCLYYTKSFFYAQAYLLQSKLFCQTLLYLSLPHNIKAYPKRDRTQIFRNCIRGAKKANTGSPQPRHLGLIKF